MRISSLRTLRVLRGLCVECCGLRSVAVARACSPRYDWALAGSSLCGYERHRDDLVSIDVSGLERLLGPPRTIGEELRREAAARGMRAHVAVAGTRMAALVLALARPGLTVVDPGGEAAALAAIPIGILEQIDESSSRRAHEFAEALRLQTLRPCGLRSNTGG